MTRLGPAANEELQNRERERDKRRRNQERADLQQVLETPTGRRVLRRILAKAGVLQSSYRPEPYDMAYAEGFRNMGLWLIEQLKLVREDAWLQLFKDEEEL